MKKYVGYRRMELDNDGKPTNSTCVVQVGDDAPGHKGTYRYDLPLRLDIRNHSRAGFDWGYEGSAPAQLALALCADCMGEKYAVPAIYQRIKAALVSNFPHDGWTLEERELKTYIAAATAEAGFDIQWSPQI